MRKTEIFAEILECVASETELTPEQILSCCRTAETVDARYILIYLLFREGFYNAEIAKLLKMSRQSVGQVLNRFHDRRKQSGKMFEITLNRICKCIENK